jgi:hypothetical protein
VLAGVSKAARELRKAEGAEQSRHVVVVARVPAAGDLGAPTKLAQLGRSLLTEGIRVSTIGVGPATDPDQLVALAAAGDGDAVLIDQSTALGPALARVVATARAQATPRVAVAVSCRAPFRPVRFLGRGGTVRGKTAATRSGGLSQAQPLVYLLELAAPALAPGRHTLATVRITWSPGMAAEQAEVTVTAVPAADVIAARPLVRDHVALQTANAKDRLTLALADEGNLQGAVDNAWLTLDFIDRYLSARDTTAEPTTALRRLQALRAASAEHAEKLNLGDADWPRRSRRMREYQFAIRQGNPWPSTPASRREP